MQEYLNKKVYEMKRSGIRVFNALAKETPGCISLTLGEPEFRTPEVVSQEAKISLDNGETHYIPNNGNESLRKAISDFEKKENGVSYSENEIIVTAGATEAIYVALTGILNPDDEVIIFQPAFNLYEGIVTLCRGKCVFVDTSKAGFQVTKEMLSEAITDRTKAVIINSPNNPTGCVLTKESLENIREAVRDTKIFVLCDEVYRQLSYNGKCPSFTEFNDMRDRTLVIQSYSKPYAMTGWRMGYLMADFPVKSELEKIHQFSVVSTPAPFQSAAIKALSCDVSEMREAYHKRRDFMLAEIEKLGLRVFKPEGAFYIFPSIEEFGIESEDFCRRMIKEAGIAAIPGSCFGGEGYIRLSYCCGDDVLAEGMKRLSLFVNKLREEQK